MQGIFLSLQREQNLELINLIHISLILNFVLDVHKKWFTFVEKLKTKLETRNKELEKDKLKYYNKSGEGTNNSLNFHDYDYSNLI